MIEVKLNDIVNNIQIFQDLSTKCFPARTAFLISRILKQVTDEYNLFQDTRTNLIKQYGDRDENGEIIIDENKNVHLSENNLDKFNQEIRDLLDTPITMELDKIPLSALEAVDFTPSQMFLLTNFIDEKK